MKRACISFIAAITFNSSVFCQGFNPDRIISVDTNIGAGTDTLNSNLVINENVTLTISAGAVLYFKKDTCKDCVYKIIVKGNLIAKGTKDHPILFTSTDSLLLNDFNGISIEKSIQSNDTAFFDHCIFENSTFSGYSNGTISVNKFSNASITNCILRNNTNLGILNKGFVRIENTSVYGGRFVGFRNEGTAKVRNTSIFDNYGGGIHNTGDLLVTNSTIYHNQAFSGTNGPDGLPGRCDCYSSINGTNGLPGGNGENGGGINNQGIAEIINTTVARNYSGNYGKGGSGGKAFQGTCVKIDPITQQVTTSYCISAAGANGANGNYGKGGGIYNTGVLKLKNAIVAYNMKCDYTDDDVWGTINSSAYNIISNKSGVAVTSDSVGNKFVDPLIDLLQYNGGITPTCALQFGSPAINALPQGMANVPAFDQRDFLREGNPDVGSFEFNNCIPAELKTKWNPTRFGQDSWALDISVANDSTVWVKDANADSVSMTTNGGVSWISKPLPLAEGFPAGAGGISALDGSNAFYILSSGNSKGIYRTTDGGNSWTKQTTGFNQNSLFPDIVHFWNEKEGVAIGDASPDFEIYTTTNGGIQWNRVDKKNMPDGKSEGTWNSQETYSVVGNSIFYLTTSARIFKSADKGKTWNVINTPFHNANDSTLTFDFKDNDNGLISYCSHDGQKYKMYRTTDGGQTWNTLTTNNFYQRIKYIPNAGAYFSMNINGGLSYSCDDGQTWTNIPDFKTVKLRTVGFSPNGKIFWGGLRNIYSSSQVLTVSASILTIEAPANSLKTFELFSNTPWTITSSQSWLTTGIASGSGNATITLSALANKAMTTRTAILTISGNGVPTRIITVVQDGATTGNTAVFSEEDMIYPNPASNVLYLGKKEDTVRISIYNATGTMILDRQIWKNQIDVGFLHPGIYLIRIKKPEGIVIRKFVKQ